MKISVNIKEINRYWNRDLSPSRSTELTSTENFGFTKFLQKEYLDILDHLRTAEINVIRYGVRDVSNGEEASGKVLVLKARVGQVSYFYLNDCEGTKCSQGGFCIREPPASIPRALEYYGYA